MPLFRSIYVIFTQISDYCDFGAKDKCLNELTSSLAPRNLQSLWLCTWTRRIVCVYSSTLEVHVATNLFNLRRGFLSSTTSLIRHFIVRRHVWFSFVSCETWHCKTLILASSGIYSLEWKGTGQLWPSGKGMQSQAGVLSVRTTQKVWVIEHFSPNGSFAPLVSVWASPLYCFQLFSLFFESKNSKLSMMLRVFLYQVFGVQVSNSTSATQNDHRAQFAIFCLFLVQCNKTVKYGRVLHHFVVLAAMQQTLFRWWCSDNIQNWLSPDTKYWGRQTDNVVISTSNNGPVRPTLTN